MILQPDSISGDRNQPRLVSTGENGPCVILLPKWKEIPTGNLGSTSPVEGTSRDTIQSLADLSLPVIYHDSEEEDDEYEPVTPIHITRTERAVHSPRHLKKDM